MKKFKKKILILAIIFLSLAATGYYFFVDNSQGNMSDKFYDLTRNSSFEIEGKKVKYGKYKDPIDLLDKYNFNIVKPTTPEELVLELNKAVKNKNWDRYVSLTIGLQKQCERMKTTIEIYKNTMLGFWNQNEPLPTHDVVVGKMIYNDHSILIEEYTGVVGEKERTTRRIVETKMVDGYYYLSFEIAGSDPVIGKLRNPNYKLPF
jgi:hypothetical protein